MDSGLGVELASTCKVLSLTLRIGITRKGEGVRKEGGRNLSFILLCTGFLPRAELRQAFWVEVKSMGLNLSPSTY